MRRVKIRTWSPVTLAVCLACLLLPGRSTADDGPDYFNFDDLFMSAVKMKKPRTLFIIPRYYNLKGMFDDDRRWNSLGGTSQAMVTAGFRVEVNSRLELAAYSSFSHFKSRYNPGSGIGESWVRIKFKPLPRLPLAVRLAGRHPGDASLWQHNPLTKAVDLSLLWEKSAASWALNLASGYRLRFSGLRYEPGPEVHTLAEFSLREDITGVSVGLLGHYGFAGKFDGAAAPDTYCYLLTLALRYFYAVDPRIRYNAGFLYDMAGRNRMGGFVFSASAMFDF